MRSHKTEGVIIKRKNLGEADRIITVFTKTEGKITLIAKGVRKISSRRASHIELLNQSILTYHASKLPVLTEVEALNHFSSLKSDLGKAGLAFYICELVEGLCAEHQENRAVFNLLIHTLGRMEEEDNCREIVKDFETELLNLLGFWPKEKAFAFDTTHFIENILERRIKTKKILTHLS
jgi:DNA repair protein RecO (recombination protein O)